MRQEIKNTLLEKIADICDTFIDIRDIEDGLQAAEEPLKAIADFMGVSKMQAFILAIIFEKSSSDGSASFTDIARHCACSVTHVLNYFNDFEILCEMKLLKKVKSRRRRFEKGNNFSDEYVLNREVTEALLYNKAIDTGKTKPIKDIYDLLEEVFELVNDRDREESNVDDLLDEISDFINHNNHFPLIQKLKPYQLELVDGIVFLTLVWQTLCGRGALSLTRFLDDLYDDKKRHVINYLQGVNSGNNLLVKNNLVSVIGVGFFNETAFKLTAHAREILKDAGITISLKEIKEKDLILPENTLSKDLFFDQEKMKQLYLIQNLMKEEEFERATKLLKEKGLSSGITILLHGYPGTGKTEVVKQIAKESNRKIMKVEISEAKSKWFGESEKLIKQIFTDYESLCESSEQMPILLFNEADAIISKRRNTSNSNTGQTENAIQNILLEELENFNGILMATTNLIDNIDNAFDRRFLFKIKFDKPAVDIRSRIWASKLEGLSEEEYKVLAEDYFLSGGQIENIVRKSTIEEILKGKKPDFDLILQFCEEENRAFEKKHAPIGFMK